MLVEKGIQKARDGDIVTVVADDADTLILLLYHWHDNMRAVYFFRSSHRRCSVKKGVVRKFAKYTGKHVPEPFFQKG